MHTIELVANFENIWQKFQKYLQAEVWFHEGSRLLMLIAKKSSTIRTPQEANELLEEIELFLKPGETKQEERIQQISELSYKLYGKSKSSKCCEFEKYYCFFSYNYVN